MGCGSAVKLAAASAVVLALAGCGSLQGVRHRGGDPCRETTVTLYFETGSDQVSAIGRQIIAATSNRLHLCPVRELRLLGLADPAGAPQANLELSERRAFNVRNAFERTGLAFEHFTIVAAGDRGAERPNGVVEPVRRRVDATLLMGK